MAKRFSIPVCALERNGHNMETIKKFIKADKAQIKEIREVEEQCRSHDRLTGIISLDASLNFKKDMKSLFLLYDSSKLVSFLTIFAPDYSTAEISAITLPEYRRRGYFDTLFVKVAEEIKKYAIGDVIFVCERRSDDGFETVVKYGAKLSHTEYSLKYKGDMASLFEYPFKLELYKCSVEDIGMVAQLDAAIFGMETEEAKSFAFNTMNAENRTQFAVKLGEKAIGLVSAGEEDGNVTIYGLGILPEYRGRGYGKELLYLILKHLVEQGYQSIGIEVDSLNETANKLYFSSGFETETTVDYYRKKL